MLTTLTTIPVYAVSIRVSLVVSVIFSCYYLLTTYYNNFCFVVSE